MKNVVYEVLIQLRGDKGSYCIVDDIDEAMKEAYRLARKPIGRLEFRSPVLKVTIYKSIKGIGRFTIAVIYPAHVHNYKRSMVYDE